MTEAEIRKLYAIAMAYDNRKLSNAGITAWWEQAERNRWTFDEAREAIHRHHATSTEFLMPAHVTTLIRAERRQPAPVRQLALPAAPPAQQGTIRRVVSDLARQLGWRRGTVSGEDQRVLAVECPHCQAGPMRPCTRLATRGPHRGEHMPLRRGFHPSRVDLAREVPA